MIKKLPQMSFITKFVDSASAFLASRTCQRYVVGCLSSVFIATSYARAIVDVDVQAMVSLETKHKFQQGALETIPLIVFVRTMDEQDALMAELASISGVRLQKIASAPAVLVMTPAPGDTVNTMANIPAVTQISSYQPAREELENSEQAILLKSSSMFPDLKNWWDAGYSGAQGVVGLIDSGVAIEHASLKNKTILTRTEPNSGYGEFKNGIRSAHGTGIACIYMGAGSETFPEEKGIAFGAMTMMTGLAGEGDGYFDDLSQTLGTLDWMLTRHTLKPTVINYSFGNGSVKCNTCVDWSGFARVADYTIQHYKILWIKSAGNVGLEGGLTSPADNYNGLTVANMNPAYLEDGRWILSPYRNLHTIRYTSSRGPTIDGRKKPDLTAPGNGTRTCAPDPGQYVLHYTDVMDYHDGYRLMGGTSAAAPHVGAAVLLLQEAGIKEPIAQKALLINAADAWFDDGQPGPDDPKNLHHHNGHYPVQGSLWNRTYGWGYLNLQAAYDQRQNIVMGELRLDNPEQTFEVDLPVGSKVTLVHERRVGYHEDGRPWDLSPLSLQIINAKTGHVVDEDRSPQDTVHQVAYCQRKQNETNCSVTEPIHAIVKVTLLSHSLDGSEFEPFALAMPVAGSVRVKPYSVKSSGVSP